MMTFDGSGGAKNHLILLIIPPNRDSVLTSPQVSPLTCKAIGGRSMSWPSSTRTAIFHVTKAFACA